MLDKKRFKELIQERINSEGLIEAGDTTAWDNLAKFLSADIAASIDFLEHECSPDDIYWVSEVFDDIARKTQSKDFIAAIHRIYDKMPENVKETMEVDIRSAEQAIDGD